MDIDTYLVVPSSALPTIDPDTWGFKSQNLSCLGDNLPPLVAGHKGYNGSALWSAVMCYWINQAEMELRVYGGFDHIYEIARKHPYMPWPDCYKPKFEASFLKHFCSAEQEAGFDKSEQLAEELQDPMLYERKIALARLRKLQKWYRNRFPWLFADEAAAPRQRRSATQPHAPRQAAQA